MKELYQGKIKNPIALTSWISELVQYRADIAFSIQQLAPFVSIK